MGRVSNKQIVEELKKGDRKGADHLVDLYQNRLMGEALSIFHIPAADAEEIVSDVLLAVVQRIESFEFGKSEGDFHFWVMTIFRNRVRDYARHKAITEGFVTSFETSSDSDDSQFDETEREVTRSILHQYEESLRKEDETEEHALRHPGKLERIAEVLDSMETWERVLLRCRALDVPYEDIARYTGKTAQQLKVYHARVKRKFVKLLAKYYPELGDV